MTNNWSRGEFWNQLCMQRIATVWVVMYQGVWNAAGMKHHWHVIMSQCIYANNGDDDNIEETPYIIYVPALARTRHPQFIKWPLGDKVIVLIQTLRGSVYIKNHQPWLLMWWYNLMLLFFFGGWGFPCAHTKKPLTYQLSYT